MPHTNASTNLAGFVFPTEAGVNTNQSEWPSQGQFQRIVSTAEKNSKSAFIEQNRGGKRRLFKHLLRKVMQILPHQQFGERTQ
ncbi:hypothetical protein C3709_03325 [Lelliottia aquatilis]|uniref:Uncharacterized protein n=1 Tax=Lelliottia aquatilis TaxID=2080838 RepID=A0ABX5A561_9ENTR|nr:hypothetical protein C3Z09_10150 [Lelliottia aquatilis]POZ28929.1 hypothetical protein C3708_03325 [Lelliottia sp. 7254-16]POZ25773.1 hypothetical protein C3712_03325 [Lelliottia aquatilis]POZ29327.1 hypothetical protein C3711_04555 [Lelliottia aquatilis]POZ33234.1 hypothetical protein C3710_07315 [Lelliottia aquatilis]